VTLVEVLVVVAIIAMVSSGVALYALPRYREAQSAMAKRGARVLRHAVHDWQRVENRSDCPSVAELVQLRHLDPGQSARDSWNREFRIYCEQEDVVVSSAGRDGRFGTSDDIVVPDLPASASAHGVCDGAPVSGPCAF
jgi:general secretion pathway protein G